MCQLYSRSKLFKIAISLFLLVACVLSIFLVSKSSNFFAKNEEIIPDQINKIPTEYGVDLHVKNGKILYTRNVNPNKEGSKAVINYTTGKGFVIVDPQGNVIDDLQDFHKEMESRRVNKGSKHVSAILSVGHFFGENHLVFLSNYTEDDPRANLWLLDLETREFKKLFDAATFGDMIIKYFSQEKLIVWTEKEDIYYTVYPDETYEAIDINGYIESVSPDGNIIAYRQRLDEALMEHGIRFLDINEGSSIQADIDLSYRYNGSPTWNEAGDKFASFIRNIENAESFIFVFDLATQKEIFIPSDDQPFTPNGPPQFITDNIIQAEFEDGSNVQYSIK